MPFGNSNNRQRRYDIANNLSPENVAVEPTGFVEAGMAAMALTLDEEMLLSDGFHTSESSIVDSARTFLGFESNEFVKRNKTLDEYMENGSLTKDEVRGVTEWGSVDYDGLAILAQGKGLESSTDEELMDNLRDTLKQRREYGADIMGRADGAGVAGIFAGSMAMSMGDPQNLATLLVAPHIRAAQSMTFAQRAMERAVVTAKASALVAVPTQGQIYKFKQEIDSPWGASDVAINVIADVVGNVALDQLSHGVGAWLRGVDQYQFDNSSGNPKWRGFNPYRWYKQKQLLRGFNFPDTYPGLPAPQLKLPHLPGNLLPLLPPVPDSHLVLSPQEMDELAFIAGELENLENIYYGTVTNTSHLEDNQKYGHLTAQGVRIADDDWQTNVEKVSLFKEDIASGAVYRYLPGMPNNQWNAALKSIKESGAAGVTVKAVMQAHGIKFPTKDQTIVPVKGTAFFHSGAGSHLGTLRAPVFFADQIGTSATYLGLKEGGVTGQYHLNVKNILDSTAPGMRQKTIDKVIKLAKDLGYPVTSTSNSTHIGPHDDLPHSKKYSGSSYFGDLMYLKGVRDALKKEGYDSLRWADTGLSPSTIVFDPWNIIFLGNTKLMDMGEIRAKSVQLQKKSHYVPTSLTHEQEAKGLYKGYGKHYVDGKAISVSVAQYSQTGSRANDMLKKWTKDFFDYDPTSPSAAPRLHTDFRISMVDPSLTNGNKIADVDHENSTLELMNSLSDTSFTVDVRWMDHLGQPRSNDQIQDAWSNAGQVMPFKAFRNLTYEPSVWITPAMRQTPHAEHRRQGISPQTLYAGARVGQALELELGYQAAILGLTEPNVYFGSDATLTKGGRQFWDKADAAGLVYRSPYASSSSSGGYGNTEYLANFWVRPEKMVDFTRKYMGSDGQSQGKYHRPNYHKGLQETQGEAARADIQKMHEQIQKDMTALATRQHQILNQQSNFQPPKPPGNWLGPMTEDIVEDLAEPIASGFIPKGFTLMSANFVNANLGQLYTPGATVKQLDTLINDMILANPEVEVPVPDPTSPTGKGAAKLQDWWETHSDEGEALLDLWQCMYN